ncbi:MAG: hypothetical protein RMK29_02290 [Myxococcales bacterium]|nr:hypothetical protein [Myxococcales bacterium]
MDLRQRIENLREAADDWMRSKSTRRMAVVLGCSVGILLLALLANRLLTRPRRPLPPSQEQPAALPPGGDIRCTPMHYQATLQQDAAAFGVPVPTLQELQQPLRGGTELRGRRLRPQGDVVETEHLRLETSIVKLRSTLDGSQGFRADHLVLRITNKSSVPVAYRVLTTLPDVQRCGSKADLPHNAIVLRPGETVERTECIFHKRRILQLIQVDAYEVTELGHRYLSRLMPSEGGPFEMRLARAHDRGGLKPCQTIPWRDLDPATDVWLAVVDFHARHNCDEYTQPRGYRPWTRPGTLPACAASSP